MTDADLLRAYAATGSHPAFSQLVAHHLDFVYASALRQTRSTALADDVAQTVFLHLAQHAAKLRPDTHLKSWLCVITRHKAIDAIRTEARRRQREHTAATLSAMDAANSSDTGDSTWREIPPTIDDALASLAESDRRAILLRFFDEKSLREIGQLLSLTEDTAQKRLTRALEKLRATLARRGIITTAALLAAQLPLHAATTAPATLSAALTSPAFLTAATSAVPLGGTLIQTLLMTASKKSVLIAALALAATLAVFEAAALAHLNQRATANELLAARLQNEAAALQNQLAQKNNQPDSSAFPPHSALTSADSLDTSLQALLERAAILQRLLDALPEERIPELRLLTDTDWLAVAAEYSLKTSSNADWALSQVRNKARHRLDPLLRSALQKFIQTSGDILPETPLALRPYFDVPIDETILARYEMAFTGTATDAGPRKPVIREKSSATDNLIDTLAETAMMGTHYATVDRWRPSRLTPELLESLRPAKTPAPAR